MTEFNELNAQEECKDEISRVSESEGLEIQELSEEDVAQKICNEDANEECVDEFSEMYDEEINEPQDALFDELSEDNELEEIILGGEELEQTHVINLEPEIESLNATHKETGEKTQTKTYQEFEEHFNSITCDRVVGVYVKTNSEGYITEVVSDMFKKDLEGYIKIDEGDGDRFVYAESCYFDEPLQDRKGNYRYKL